MRSKEEIQKEYFVERENYKKLVNDFREKEQQRENEFMSHAKYQEGDQIKFIDKFWNSQESKELEGFIRRKKLLVKGDTISICYVVAKVTKLGKMHASQNVTYRPIEEDWIIEKL